MTLAISFTARPRVRKIAGDGSGYAHCRHVEIIVAGEAQHSRACCRLRSLRRRASQHHGSDQTAAQCNLTHENSSWMVVGESTAEIAKVVNSEPRWSGIVAESQLGGPGKEGPAGPRTALAASARTILPALSNGGQSAGATPLTPM